MSGEETTALEVGMQWIRGTCLLANEDMHEKRPIVLDRLHMHSENHQWSI